MERNRCSINLGEVFSTVGKVIFVILITSVLVAIFWTVFGPWEWRARVLSYIPGALLAGHVLVFFLAIVHPRFWGFFKAYFLVTFLVYFSFLIYFLKIINSSDYGNPLALLALPIAPFGRPADVEKSIERKHEREREIAIASGSISLETIILSLDREIAESKVATPEMLLRFTSHEALSVRYAVANNSKTPREAYYKLIHEEGDAVKLKRPFMRNRHVPEDIKSMARKLNADKPELNKQLEAEWRSRGLAPQGLESP